MGRLDMSRAASAVLTTLALIPYALGWTAGALVRAADWVVGAVHLGWSDGRGRTKEGRRT